MDFECYMKEFFVKVYPLGYGELTLFISKDFAAVKMPNFLLALLFWIVNGGERA